MTAAEMRSCISQMAQGSQFKFFEWNGNVLTDNEVEYQIRTDLCGNALGILVRITDVCDRALFREFRLSSYSNVWEMLQEALSEELIDELANSLIELSNR